MMKKIFTLVLVMAAVLVNAQSIKVFYQGSELNSQDTVFLPSNNNGEDVDAFFGYQNTTNDDISYKVRKEVIFKDDFIQEVELHHRRMTVLVAFAADKPGACSSG